MNKKELKVEMLRNNDTGDDLSKALGISRQTLSNKMCESYNRRFTQKEIQVIKDRYNLSADRLVEIFFTQNMS